ncbi:MAG: IS3 family transposase, partial [Pseudomonadota bacterium]
MKKSRFSEQQIAFILKQVDDGIGVDEVCRKAGVSQQTYYRWRKKYGGLMPSEVRGLKQLEEENGRLKRMVADLSLDKAMLQDVLGKKGVAPAKGRQLVDYVRGAFQVSVRRGCTVLGLQKSTYFYKARRPSQAALRKRIREIAETRVRYGYRRIHVLLTREGWSVNAKRVYRLYAEEGLAIRNKRPKRKVAAKLREDRRKPVAPGDVWAMDFLSDQLFDGTKIRVLTIVDTFSKVSPAIDVRSRYTGADVVTTLERVTQAHGTPRSIRVDQGPEFISKDLDLWAYMNGVILDFSRPGKPTDNAYAEAFNGKVRAECIDQNWFLSIDDARLKC